MQTDSTLIIYVINIKSLNSFKLTKKVSNWKIDFIVGIMN